MTLLMANFFEKEIILGLTVQEFLLHLLNFVILIVALRFLLYKPVKKFMQKRKEEYETAEEKYQNSLKETEQAAQKAEITLENAREEAVKIAEEAHAMAMIQTEEIIAGAHEEADAIIQKAQAEAKAAVKGERDSLYHDVSALAVEISEKLLARELRSEDTDVFIDNLIEGIKKREDGEENA